MITEKEFINYLLEKSKDFKDDIFIPNEFEIKISEIENFSFQLVQKLSQKEETVLNQTIANSSGTISRDYKTPVVEFDLEKNSLKFYPSVLKNYLKKLGS